jgi:hypothetical protein
MLNEILPGFALNMVVITIIVGFIYHPTHRHGPEYVFTFFSFSVLIYFVSLLLREVQLTIGFGFGLLAVFSTLRYRTMRIPIREMTYLFISITIPFMNTLFMATRITFPELAIVNGMIVVVIFLLEKQWGMHYEASKRVLYEKIDLVKPEHYQLLLEDLRRRTGLNIKRFEVEEIDFLRDTAELTIYYDESPPPSHPD